MSPYKIMRLKCLECCCDSKEEVKLCTSEDCPLHPYRFGKNPNSNRVRTLSDEERKAIGERLSNSRKKSLSE